MGIGVSLIVIAVGAILTWAVTASTSGIDVNAVGVILMIVGLIGFILSLVFWSTWWGFGYFRGSVPAGPAVYRRHRRSAAPDERDRRVEETVEEERY